MKHTSWLRFVLSAGILAGMGSCPDALQEQPPHAQNIPAGNNPPPEKLDADFGILLGLKLQPEVVRTFHEWISAPDASEAQRAAREIKKRNFIGEFDAVVKKIELPADKKAGLLTKFKQMEIIALLMKNEDIREAYDTMNFPPRIAAAKKNGKTKEQLEETFQSTYETERKRLTNAAELPPLTQDQIREELGAYHTPLLPTWLRPMPKINLTREEQKAWERVKLNPELLKLDREL